MAVSPSTVEALRAALPPPKPPTGNEPQVLIKSPLVLTLEQEQNLCTGLAADFRRLSVQQGRQNFGTQDWIMHLQNHIAQYGEGATPFMTLCHLAHQLRNGRVEWRRAIIGGLFAESNVHIPLTERYVGQQTARACDSFFGTRPWFTATAVNSVDSHEAEQITQWTRHAADEAELEATFRETMDLAFTQGWQVVSLHQDAKLDYYKTTKVVAVDAKGTPIAALDGDYIYQTDKFVPLPPPADPFAAPAGGPAGPVPGSGFPVPGAGAGAAPADPTQVPGQGAPDGQSGQDGLNGQPGQGMPVTPPALPAMPPQPVGPLVLERDMKTPAPVGTLNFQPCSITRLNKRFEGARCSNVFYQDWLCPLEAQNIQDAEVCFEVVTIPLMSLVHSLLTNDAWREQMPDVETQRQTISRLLNDFTLTPASSNTQGSEGAVALRPRSELQETETATGGSPTDPNITLLKAWKHVDANNDGFTESLVALMTLDGQPVYYDYVANMTHDGLRPYEVVRVNPVAGRWYGIGEPIKFYDLQAAADLLFNRFLWLQSQAGNLIFWDPSMTIEGQADKNLQLNNGTTYKLQPNKRAEDACKVIPIHFIKGEELIKALEIVFQAFANRSGVASPNDSRMAGLDTAQLATGVNNIERSGQELFGKFLSDLTGPVRNLVRRFLGLALFHIDEGQTFMFFEGDNATFVTLSPEQLKDLTLHVVIDLSRYNGQQQLLQAQAVAAVMDRFFAYAQSPQLMVLAQPIYLKLAKASGMQDAEKTFPSVEQLQGLQAPEQRLSLPPGASSNPGTAPAAKNPQPPSSLV